MNIFLNEGTHILYATLRGDGPQKQVFYLKNLLQPLQQGQLDI
jgi:hypothetical protein